MSYGTVYAAESDVVPKVKVKRPGFLARWFIKKFVEGYEQQKQEHEANVLVKRQSIGLDRGALHIDQPERAIQFTVYNANGGRVVETRRYDKKTDRSANGLYVITSDADFGKEIDKIITMEALR